MTFNPFLGTSSIGISSPSRSSSSSSPRTVFNPFLSDPEPEEDEGFSLGTSIPELADPVQSAPRFSTSDADILRMADDALLTNQVGPLEDVGIGDAALFGTRATLGAWAQGALGIAEGIGTAGRKVGEVVSSIPGVGRLGAGILTMGASETGPLLEQGAQAIGETDMIQDLTQATAAARTLGAVPSFAMDVNTQVPQIAAAPVAPTSLLLPALGTASAGGAIQEAEAEGASDLAALGHGVVSGVAEGALEKFGALPTIRNLVSAVPGAMDNLAATVLKAAAGEFGQEAATSLAQQASSALFTDQDWQTLPALAQAIYEGGIGAVSGGGAVATTGAMMGSQAPQEAVPAPILPPAEAAPAPFPPDAAAVLAAEQEDARRILTEQRAAGELEDIPTLDAERAFRGHVTPEGVTPVPVREAGSLDTPGDMERFTQEDRVYRALDDTLGGDQPAPVAPPPPPPVRVETTEPEPVEDTQTMDPALQPEPAPAPQPKLARAAEPVPETLPKAEPAPEPEPAPKLQSGPVPKEALGVVAQPVVPDPSELKRIVKKYGTSLGAWTKPARAVVEKAKQEKGAARSEAMTLANAMSRLELAHLKKNPTVKRGELEDSITAHLEGQKGTVPLPPDIAKVADRMREIVSGLQTKQADVLEAQGRTELADVFRSNLGKRLTRSYRAFEDKKHVKKLKKSGQWESIRAQIQAMPEFSGKSDAEMDDFMEDFAGRDPLIKEGTKGGGTGTQFEGIFKQRQDIPAPLRALLGEHTTASERFFKTTERLQRNVSTYEMYRDLAGIGVAEGWAAPPGEALGGESKVIPETGTRNPMAGWRVRSDMADAILEADSPINQDPVTKVLGWMTGAVKWNKTVGSVQSQARNFLGNFLLKSGTGNLGGKALPWNRAKGAGKTGVVAAAKGVKSESGRGVVRAIGRAEALGNLDGLSLEDVLSRNKRAAELGLTDSNPDLKDLDYFFGESDPLSLEEQAPIRKLREVKQTADRMYRLGDQLFKLDGWVSETNKLRYAYPKMSQEEAEAKAADRVRDLYPTADRAAKGLQAIRQTPFIGGFISFWSEIPRVAKNIVKLGISEVKEGKATGNKKLQTVGVHRLASFGASIAAVDAAALAIRAATDDDEDGELEKAPNLRPFLPDYLDNAKIPVLAKGDGWAVATDLSFLDPWAVLKKPMYAAIRSMELDEKGVDRAVWEGFKAFVEPYVQQGLVVGPLYEAIWSGKDSNGKAIYHDKEPIDSKFEKITAYLTKRFEPGTASTAKRIGAAVASGDPKKVGTESLATVGPRLLWLDMNDKIPSLGYGFKDTASAATTEFNRSLRENKTKKDRDKARTVAEEMYRSAAKDLTEGIKTARQLKVKRADIRELLRSAKVSEATVNLAFEGQEALIRAYREKLKEDEQEFLDSQGE